jgi:hypothetical protein
MGKSLRTCHIGADIDHQRHHSLAMHFLPHFLRVLLGTASCIILSGCLVEHSNPIKTDAKVDPRLEGVWVIQEKTEDEIHTDGDASDIGAQSYLIFAKVDEGTYRVLAIDSFEKEEENNVFEMLASTRKHLQHDFLSARLPKHLKKKVGEGEMTSHDWLVDYKIDSKGQLFLRYFHIEDFAEVQAVHPMTCVLPDQPFGPLTLTGSEEEILKLYSDPKVRALFTSCGKYRKLQLPAE